MKNLAFTISLLLLAVVSHAQKIDLSGSVLDEQDQPLIGATVVLINPVDSIMEGFSITNGDGVFEIRKVMPGEYTLQITYLGYGTFENMVNVVSEESKLDVGAIRLAGDENLLDAVEITGKFVPLVIKKDTIEYNADAFRVRPNATVEELLKKLPGIEVDKDGAITAEGEDVTKVTVDGKSFFGNDPKAATRNLPADAIKKVQVIDEKSKAAQFSGVDDGNESKTINLELKEDRKKGYFGNAKAGYGTSDRIDTKLNINSFNKKVQLSGIVGFNNINENGFSFNDYQSLIGDSGGGRRGGFDSPLDLNFGNLGNGDSENLSGGLNFNYDLGKKSTFNASYYLINTNQRTLQGVYKENTLAAQAFINRDTSVNDSKVTQHLISSSVELRLDSVQWFDFSVTASVNDNSSLTDEVTAIDTITGALISNIAANQSSVANNANFDFSGEYNRKLGKKGRILNATFNYGVVEQQDSLDVFQELLEPVEQQMLLLSQYQLDTATNNNYRLNIGYKEPLGKNQYLDIDYNRRNFDSYRIRDFIDKDQQVRDNALASATDNTTVFDEYELEYSLDKDKVQFQAGIMYHNAFLTGDQFNFQEGSNTLIKNEEASVGKRRFGAFLPSASVRLFDRAIRISYDTDLNEPSISRLQTILDNTNPNRIVFGNQNLVPEYEHRFQVRIRKFDRFTFRGLFANLTYTLTEDNIVDSIQVQDRAVQIITPVNGGASHSINSWISAFTPINPMYIKLGVSANGSFSTRDNYVNNQLDRVTSISPSVKFEIENLNNDHFTAVVYSRTSWNNNNYEINSSLNRRFLTQTYGAELIVEFGKGFVLDTEIDYFQYFNEDEKLNDYALWNASVSKTFMNDQFTAKVTAFDILNQNEGIDVSQGATSLTQTRSNSLQQYVMFSLQYRFSSFGGAGPSSNNRMFISK